MMYVVCRELNDSSTAIICNMKRICVCLFILNDSSTEIL